MIYLDYAANTPADPQVLETFVSCERKYAANPNASHPMGALARQALAEVTERIASALCIDAAGLIYTSGASEANNTAIKGMALARRQAGQHIITTPLEHPSVSGPLDWLKKQGWEIDLVNVGRDGKIDTGHLKQLMRRDTVLLAVTAVDSELGAVQPMEEIVRIKREYPGCLLHVDATQAIGKIPFSFDGVDSASFTAHKSYGLNGIGVLYKNRRAEMEPLIHGGGGPALYRGGPPTLALAASLETALRKSIDCLTERYETVKRQNDFIRAALAAYPAVWINSPAGAVPHILNLSVTGVKGTRFRDALGQAGICVSVRSACAMDGTPSAAVSAVVGDRKRALSSWRISLSHLTSEEELRQFLEAFDVCYQKLMRR